MTTLPFITSEFPDSCPDWVILTLWANQSRRKGGDQRWDQGGGWIPLLANQSLKMRKGPRKHDFSICTIVLAACPWKQFTMFNTKFNAFSTWIVFQKFDINDYMQVEFAIANSNRRTIQRHSKLWQPISNSISSNKKSRIYGTSDLSDLSIYLSALLKSASNVQIGFRTENRPQMYRSASNVQLSIYLSALLKSVHLRPILAKLIDR